jgi:hypothetical protein
MSVCSTNLPLASIELCHILFIFGIQEYILYRSLPGEYEHFSSKSWGALNNPQ